MSGTPLLLYIDATEGVVSDVLIEEHDRLGLPEQTPVYYVSEALYSTKTHYPELEKMIYGVVMASRKLKHYFTVQ